jgi:hypothetical protein
VVWRARKLVLGETDEEYERDWQLIGPFLEKLAEMNPGTVVGLERHPNNHFNRCFVMFSIGMNVGTPFLVSRK